MRRVRRVFAVLAMTALMVATTAMPAQAQVIGPILVDVDIGDVTITVPVGVAANLCDINAAILVQDFQDDGDANCTAVVDNSPGQSGAAPGRG